MKRALAIAALFTLAMPLHAAEGDTFGFEVKGYSAGADISTIDTSACRSSPSVDSGVPGFVCDTTLAGEKAELRLAVFDGKIVAVIFRVESARMTPTLEALSEKYGRPGKQNRYIEDYNWSKGEVSMSIQESRLTHGYRLLIADLALFRRASAAAAAKAKKDL
jgi:hypothetical protein